MHDWARAARTLALTVWLVIALTGAVTIYVFDYYEHAWGRGASLQVSSWVATGAALVSVFGAGLGFRYGSRNGRVPSRLVAAMAGVVVVLVTFGASSLLPGKSDGGLLYLGVGFFVVAVAVAYVACKVSRLLTRRAV